MNPNFNWAIVAERMQALQAEAGAASHARYAARVRRAAAHAQPAHARPARRSRRWLAFVPAGPGR